MKRERFIVLVEDEQSDVDVALRAFQRAGLKVPVTVVRDGQEALDLLCPESGSDGAAPQPQVVFLDLKMPRVDGWEVLRRLRETDETAELPVVVISSSSREDDVRRCYELGANSFLVKRFDPRSPGAYLAEAARYWVELNRTPGMGRRTP